MAIAAIELTLAIILNLAIIVVFFSFVLKLTGKFDIIDFFRELFSKIYQKFFGKA